MKLKKKKNTKYRKIPKISPSKRAFEKYKPQGLIFGILRYAVNIFESLDVFTQISFVVDSSRGL